MDLGSDFGFLVPSSKSIPGNRPSPTASARSRWLPAGTGSWLLAVALFGFAGLQLRQIVGDLRVRATRIDFSHYYLSVLVLKRGENPYTTDFGRDAAKLDLSIEDIRHATYPPTFLMLTEPLAALSEQRAYFLWQGLNAVLYLGAIFLLISGPARMPPARGLIFAAAAIAYPPLGDHFFFAQSEIPVLFLLCLAYCLLSKERERSAGLCLGFACLLKLFPMLLLIFLVLLKRWRALAWSLGTLVIGTVATLVTVGPSTSLSYFSAIPFVTSQEWIGRPANIALAAIVSRLVWPLTGSHPSGFAELAWRGAQAAAVLALLAITLRASLLSRPQLKAYPLWVVASVLLSPTAWIHYMVLFLIPFAAVASDPQRSASATRATIASYVMSLVTSEPILFSPFYLIPHTPTFRAVVLVSALMLLYLSVFSAFAGAYFLAVGRPAQSILSSSSEQSGKRSTPAGKHRKRNRGSGRRTR